MITEDYVSFEIAKLLKEKGFDEDCHAHWDLTTETKTPKIVLSVSSKNWNYKWNPIQFPISAPTLQMTMKWLREVHNLYIWIGHTAGKVLSWYYEIHGISDGKVKYIGGIQCGSYEVACEVAIKYSLEHLI